jgi:2-polyprenyl-6-methoxyphenol hydroxylase-like FAD-dependent oxidoreductase
LLRDSAERVTGLVVKGADELQIDARAMIGSDGRYSVMRKLGNFAFVRRDMKRDVVWFRLPKPSDWNEGFTRVNIIGGRHLIILPCFPDLLRVGMYMPKGGYAEYKRQGFERFCRDVVELEPRFEGLVEQHVRDWTGVMLLDIFTVQVERWAQDGLLLIGDAAHTCSPILGQGVNLALRDAAELAPALVELLLERKEPIVMREHLLNFERKRKRDIAFIRGFQNRNELLLSFNSWLSAGLRRVLYRLFNVLPIKPFLLSRVALGVRELSPGDG